MLAFRVGQIVDELGGAVAASFIGISSDISKHSLEACVLRRCGFFFCAPSSR